MGDNSMSMSSAAICGALHCDARSFTCDTLFNPLVCNLDMNTSIFHARQQMLRERETSQNFIQ